MRKGVLGFIVVLAGSLAWSACDEKLSTIAGPTPNLTPNFATIQSEIFEKTDSAGRTACTNCHTSTGRNPSGGLDLNHAIAYDQLINVPARGKTGTMRVVPGDPDNSYLIQKLEGTNINGRRMPNNGPPYLTDGQILIVRRWVANGAPR
jgi:Planctomycete cytochrome C